jgi:hypothetical protein
MTQYFTIEPDPPKAGKKAKLCYAGPKPWEASVSWDPEGEPTTLGGEEGCVEFTVPANASTVNFHDENGNSVDLSCVVASDP